jgi:rhodanese-related sulfurtransferase
MLHAAAPPVCSPQLAPPLRARCSRRCRHAAGAGVLARAAGGPAGAPPPDERCLRLSDAHAAWSARVPLVDVRSAREFRSEAVANARNAPLYLVPSTIPLGAVDLVLAAGPDKAPPFNPQFETQLKAALGGGGKDAPALLICSNGARAREAAALLAEEGYDALRWVEGGMAAWLDAYTPRGLPRKRVVQGVFRDTGNMMCVRAWRAALQSRRADAARRDAAACVVCVAAAGRTARRRTPCCRRRAATPWTLRTDADAAPRGWEKMT